MDPVVASLTATAIAKATERSARTLYESARELTTDASGTISETFHEGFQEELKRKTRGTGDKALYNTAQAWDEIRDTLASDDLGFTTDEDAIEAIVTAIEQHDAMADSEATTDDIRGAVGAAYQTGITAIVTDDELFGRFMRELQLTQAHSIDELRTKVEQVAETIQSRQRLTVSGVEDYNTHQEFADKLYERPEYQPPGYSERGDSRGVDEDTHTRERPHAKRRAVELVEDDRVSVILVTGESGIGKSRLLAEIGEALHDQSNVDVLYQSQPRKAVEPPEAEHTVLCLDEVGSTDEFDPEFFKMPGHDYDQSVTIVATMRPVYKDDVEGTVPDAAVTHTLTLKPLDREDEQDEDEQGSIDALLAELDEEEIEAIHDATDGNPFLARLLANPDEPPADAEQSPQSKIRQVIERRMFGEAEVLSEERGQDLLRVIAALTEYDVERDHERVEDALNVETWDEELLGAMHNTRYIDVNRRGDGHYAKRTYTYTVDIFAEYVRWRWLSDGDGRASKMKSEDSGERGPRTYRQLVYECLETNPVGITRGLVELQGSSLVRFDFFDEDAVKEWTDELLTGADGIAERLVESDAPIADVLRAQTLIGHVRPINEIPHERLLDRYEQSDAGRDSADAVFGLLTITFRQAETIAGLEQREIDENELPTSADDTFEWAQSWLGTLDSLADESDDPEIRLELAKGLVNAANNEGEAGPEYFEAMKARLDRLEELAAKPTKDEIRLRLAKGLVNAASHEGEAGPEYFEAMKARLDRLEELADESDDPEIRFALAKGLYNAASHEGKAGPEYFEAMEAHLDRLEELADESDDPEIRLELAEGLYNAAIHEGEAGPEYFEAMEARLDRLEELAAKPTKDEIRFALAKGLVNAVNNKGKAGPEYFEAMKARLDRLEELADESDDPEIRLRLAKGLYNAAIHEGKAGPEYFEAMEAHLDRLEELAAKPTKDEIRLRLAKGLVNAVNYEGEAGPEYFDRMDAHLDRLKELAADSDDPEIRPELAKGLVNAVNNKGKAGPEYFEAMEAHLDRLEELAAKPTKDEIRLGLAKGLVNAVNNKGKAGPEYFEAMEAHLDRLEELAAKPTKDEIRLGLAKGLVNAAIHEGKAGPEYFEAMEAHLDRLEELAAKPTKDEIRLELAKGLVNAAIHEGKAGPEYFEAMEAHLDRLEELAAKPTKDEIRLELAKGLVNAVNYEGEAGPEYFDRMDAHLDRLKELAADSDDPEIRLELAKGLVNAAHDEGEAGPEYFEAMKARLNRLEELAAESDDPEIRLRLAKGLVNAANNKGKAGPEYFEAMEARLNRLEELVLDNPDHKEIQELVLTGYLMALTRYVEADAYSTVSEIVSTIDEMADTAGEFWLGERGSVLRDATVRIGLELLRADRLDLFEEFVGTFRSAVSEGRWESISMKLVLAANELLGEDDISLDTHQRVVDIIENPDKS